MNKKTVWISNLTKEECLELVQALCQRSDLLVQAQQAFRQAYPEASEQMISTAITHVYLDGSRAALDWLASTELFLRNPDNEILNQCVDHLLYHLYNWHQFQTLIHARVTDLLEIIQDFKESVDNEDKEVALAAALELEKRLHARLTPPELKVDH
ncbi:MAG: hypothetical protein SAL07_08285 [Oscillatoria sp. PMC 1051.18]|nr:hypothetical protein [Oscillatoria salina IIICB1]MEC4896299.1 hypothetical protein [Oscillatoria sp. PMC 1050.18]MEC5029896.1 hypothetical protein [Oscillatoria sp. PMC 1051.18]